MNEANVQREIGVYLKEHKEDFTESMAVEVKIEKTHRFLLSKVQEHQIEGLLKSQTGMYYKISDFPITFDSKLTRFTAQKPFDFVYLNVPKAYVAICFYVPRKKKKVYFINVDTFVSLKRDSLLEKVKSYLEDDIDSFSDFAIDLHLKKTVECGYRSDINVQVLE